MKRYFVEEIPQEMRQSFFDTEYIVYNNDAFIEVARIVEPLSRSGFVLVQNGSRREFPNLTEALTVINEQLGDFDLPDSLFALIRHNYSFRYTNDSK
jgi:hypothetical protein